MSRMWKEMWRTPFWERESISKSAAVSSWKLLTFESLRNCWSFSEKLFWIQNFEVQKAPDKSGLDWITKFILWKSKKACLAVKRESLFGRRSWISWLRRHHSRARLNIQRESEGVCTETIDNLWNTITFAFRSSAVFQTIRQTPISKKFKVVLIIVIALSFSDWR